MPEGLGSVADRDQLERGFKRLSIIERQKDYIVSFIDRGCIVFIIRHRHGERSTSVEGLAEGNDLFTTRMK